MTCQGRTTKIIQLILYSSLCHNFIFNQKTSDEIKTEINIIDDKNVSIYLSNFTTKATASISA
jgi:hypothetical protein